jgi:hypothetical protein
MCCNFYKKIGLVLHNLIEYGHHMIMESPMALARIVVSEDSQSGL